MQDGGSITCPNSASEAVAGELTSMLLGVVKKYLAAALLLILAPYCPISSHAAGSDLSENATTLIEFNIPAQPLADALNLYSESAGVAILVDRELTNARRSASLKGRFSVREALGLLLSGTGLMAIYSHEDAFTLRRAEVSNSTQDTAQSIKKSQGGGSYASVVQLALEKALCSSEVTRPGSYRIAFQLWIGAHGEVQHSRLLSSSGDVQRDDHLVNVLRGLRVPQAPPTSLSQPLTILVLPEAENSGATCHRFEGIS